MFCILPVQPGGFLMAEISASLKAHSSLRHTKNTQFSNCEKVVSLDTAKANKPHLLWVNYSEHSSYRKMLWHVEIAQSSPYHTSSWHAEHRHCTDQPTALPVLSELPAISHLYHLLVVGSSLPRRHRTPSPGNCRCHAIPSTCLPVRRDLWKISVAKLCHKLTLNKTTLCNDIKLES